MRIEIEYFFLLLVVGCIYIGFRLVLRKSNKSEMMKLEEQLQVSEELYKSLFEYNQDAVYSFDFNGTFTSANLASSLLTGYSQSELLHKNFTEIIHPEDLEETKATFDQIKNGKQQYINVRLIHKEGHEIFIRVTGLPILIKGQIVGVYGMSKDITEKKKSDELVKHLAYHDYLTGLPNRNLLNNHLKQMLSETESNKSIAVLSIDLDRFKVINDTLGHSVGDKLLIEVSKRLRFLVHDKDIIFRQGGDEFIITLDNVTREELSIIANSIIEVLASPFKINSYEIFTTPSIGISLFPQDGETIEMLLKHAETAMYQAKKAGKNTYKFYSLSEESFEFNPLQLEMDLHKALEREELILYYQPKVNLKTGELIGTEALIRWNHPKWGMVSPAKFIPIAEESGLIIPIGEWAIRQACIQNKKWQDQGYQFSISVNLSARQFLQSNLVQIVSTILEETKLEPKYLELEITESMTADIERTITTLQELKRIGVRISIDDFGTGFSSLNYLKRFPVDTLKIDQSFVRELHNNPNDETIVKTIISMAHSLNLQVVAEGIETQEQLVFLQQHLCDGGQGYFFSKPRSPLELLSTFNEVGQVVGEYGIHQDENERIWIEELIRMNKKELQETIRLQQGMTLKYKKINGRFIHTLCDGELLYRFGLIPEKIIGKELLEFLPVEIANEKQTYYERAWSGEGNVTYATEINGIHYLSNLRPIRRGGEVVEVIASCVDITERKNVEKALYESEWKYRLIAENTIDLIAILDVEGNVLYASPSHEAVLGYSIENYIGKSKFNDIHPEDLSLQKLLFNEAVHKKEPLQTEYRIVKRDGNYGLFEQVLTPILDENGNVEHIVGVARDITEKKKAEDLLWKTEKLSVVGELAAGVAHEIRNPMTSIKGFFQLFQEGVIKQDYFDIVINEFKRIEEIISSFINLAKPQQIEVRKVDFQEILNDVNVLIESESNLQNIQIIQQFEGSIPNVNCDPNQIKQVLLNLMKNSMEALPNGGQIHVNLSTTGDEVLITVTDNGIGMSEDRVQRLGEPYYSNKEKGTGLGLMLCFRIIQHHNGSIIINSSKNEGTSVEVRLPIQVI